LAEVSIYYIAIHRCTRQHLAIGGKTRCLHMFCLQVNKSGTTQPCMESHATSSSHQHLRGYSEQMDVEGEEALQHEHGHESPPAEEAAAPRHMMSLSQHVWYY
jgi:hypothetical protein